LVLSSARPALAHKMELDVKVENGRITVTAYYETDEPADEARVRVLDASGQEVLAGKTDAKGLWSAPQPLDGTYTVEVKEVGHRAVRTITVGAVQVEQEPSRPATPWGRVALGLAVIAALALGLRLAARRPKP
jgi:hypothetical protein